jgi:hypothetical protein
MLKENSSVGYVLSSESRERAALRAFVWIDPSASRPWPCCLFPIRQKIPKFGDPSWPRTGETKELGEWYRACPPDVVPANGEALTKQSVLSNCA